MEVSTQVHTWRIHDREYERHERRRGQRFAYKAADPRRMCLVVVDMVRFFVDESPYVRGILPQVNRAAATVRHAGGIVAWVVPAVGSPSEWQVGFYGPEVAASYATSGGSGAPADRVASELSVDAGDLVLEKSAASAFFPGRCDLHEHLAPAGITRVLIAGTVTSVCCESTARDAATLGYEVIVLGDATADVNDPAHNAALRTVYRSFGDVRSVDEVLDLIANLKPVRAPPSQHQSHQSRSLLAPAVSAAASGSSACTFSRSDEPLLHLTPRVQMEICA